MVIGDPHFLLHCCGGVGGAEENGNGEQHKYQKQRQGRHSQHHGGVEGISGAGTLGSDQ